MLSTWASNHRPAGVAQGGTRGAPAGPAPARACHTAIPFGGTRLRAEPAGGFPYKPELLGFKYILVHYSFKKFIGFHCLIEISQDFLSERGSIYEVLQFSSPSGHVVNCASCAGQVTDVSKPEDLAARAGLYKERSSFFGKVTGHIPDGGCSLSQALSVGKY